MNTNGNAIKVINKLYKTIQNEKCEYISNIQLINENLFEWEIQIFGPINSPYDGGLFTLYFKFTNDYPFKPPYVKFKTNIYHPNIAITDGKICVDILNEKWSPANTIDSIIMSIISLLNDPNPSSPLNAEAADLYVKNIKEYRKKVRKFMIDKGAYIN